MNHTAFLRFFAPAIAVAFIAIFAVPLPFVAQAATDEGLPTRGPIGPYLMPDRQAEVALARTAAPPSISADATVLVLTSHGYETAVKGTNGFVCLIERSWNSAANDTEFWNPKERGPDCYNPPGARTELQYVLKQAQWALAGLSAQQILEKTKAAVADHTLKPPEPGSFGLMLSKQGYLNHAHGPWHPHVMFFVPPGRVSNWAPDLDGSPLLSSDLRGMASSRIYIPVRAWSDGTPDLPAADGPHH